MIDSLFPSADRWFASIAMHTDRLFFIVVIGVIIYGLWRTHWRTRYLRSMKQTFENSNLFVKPKKEKLFPILLSLSDREDDTYYIFRYRLRPGMAVAQFEEKKKVFESAFNREARVYGKGQNLIIKIKKTKELSTDYSKWTIDSE